MGEILSLPLRVFGLFQYESVLSRCERVTGISKSQFLAQEKSPAEWAEFFIQEYERSMTRRANLERFIYPSLPSEDSSTKQESSKDSGSKDISTSMTKSPSKRGIEKDRRVIFMAQSYFIQKTSQFLRKLFELLKIR